MLGENLSRQKVSGILERARRSASPLLDLDPQQLRAYYDQRPFRIAHRLHEHELFQMESLQELCRRRRDLVSVRAGKVPIAEDFLRSFDHYPLDAKYEDVVADPVRYGAYLVISNPERDGVYRPVIESMLGEIALATRGLESRMTWLSSYLFISSEASRTPYHMDRELNFLMQVRGQKSVDLWSPTDDEVMTPAQRDELLAYASEQRPPYRPEFAAKAENFLLEPGQGVHHPFIAPHLVSTMSALSISFALTYRTVRTDIRAAAHLVNHKMRCRGLAPRPVGQSPMVDRSKAMVLGAWRRLRKLTRMKSSAT